MKTAIALGTLCAALSSHAADTDGSAPLPPANSASAVEQLKARRPTMPVPKLAKMPRGDYAVRVYFVVKANGYVDNVRTEGKAPREARRLVADAFSSHRCLPGDTDLESTAVFGLREKTYQ